MEMSKKHCEIVNKEKSIVKTYLLYSFVIAWVSEFGLLLLYKANLLSGTWATLLHFCVIGFGAGMAPTYAAFIAEKKHNAITKKEFLRKIFETENIKKSIVILLLFAIIQFIACAVQEEFLGYPWYYFILFIPMMIVGGGLEEIGWQGVFQPYLQKRFSFLLASIIGGVVWSIWHLPLWLIPNSSQSAYSIIAFTFFCITLGTTLAAAHKITKSIWVSVLLHAWSNTVLGGMYSLTSLCNAPNLKTISVYCVQILIVIVVLCICEKFFKNKR